MIKIGILEDNKIVGHLIEQVINRNFKAEIINSRSLEEFHSKETLNRANILLLDFNLGSFHAPQNIFPLLDHLNNECLYKPVIVYSSLRDPYRIKQVEDRGVFKFVSKDSKDSLDNLIFLLQNTIHWLTIKNKKYI